MAVLATSVSYGVRLLIRSSMVVSAKGELMASVRSHAGIEENQPVPTRAFLKWLILRFPFKAIARATRYWFGLREFGFVFNLALPLIIIWTSSVVRGMKVAITLAVLTLAGSYASFGAYQSVVTRSQIFAKFSGQEDDNQEAVDSQEDPTQQLLESRTKVKASVPTGPVPIHRHRR
jgi:hypothetical protein